MFSLTPATYVATDSALRHLIQHLAAEPFVAIDTESNSLYAYREQVCLFQITTRQGDFILDPFAITDMSPLQTVLANPHIEKIFHAAEYDLMGIKRDYGFRIHNIFDTMLAARLTGHFQVGLNTLVQDYLGVTLDKRHQRDNWGARPLPEDSLRYAQMDTHFLPMLRNDLYDRLRELGRMDEAREAFEELEYVQPAAHTFDPDGFWRLGRPHRLNRQQMAVLRSLYLLREDLAEQRDCPPFKVFGNSVLVELARHAPHNRPSLAKIKGMSSSVIRRYGDRILAAIEDGRATQLPRPPRARRADPDVMERYSALREWRKVRANQRGVDSDVIVSKNILWTLAQEAPQSLDAMQDIPGLGPWRLAQYGDELLEVLQEVD
jgi:ribonuclease D